MIISVASGKGGTGKTTISTSIALSLEKNVQFLDCDVEEPNAHLFLKPEKENTESVYVQVPVVDRELCTYCGECGKICRSHAIVSVKKSILVFPQLCHSCGGCMAVCPVNAIEEVQREIGVIESGKRGDIEFYHGILNIGEAMSPPLIKEVKKKINREKTVIIDAPPGTTCPVVETIRGSDFVILVTEPTPFGLNDLEIAVGMTRIMKIPFGIIINRSDIGDDRVVKYCKKENIPVLLEIPNDRKIAEGYSRGITLVENRPEWKDKFEKVMKGISC